MIDPNVILFANEAFYIAINSRDIAAMERLWARHTPPACIHPGWRPLTDRNAILQSWRDILGNEEGAPEIQCHEPFVLYQQDIFSVLCYEQLPQGWLTATNNFVIEDGDPKIFHHQASQCIEPPEVGTPPRPQ